MFHWLIPLLVFAAVFLLAWLALTLERHWRVRQAARALAAPPAIASGARRQPLRDLLFKLTPVLGSWQERWLSDVRRAAWKKSLSQLPAWRARGVGEWLAVKELAVLGGVLAAGLMETGWVVALALGAAAFALPDLWLREQLRTRNRAILRELPETLDLLGACMEAGLGFEQAVSVFLERGRKGPMTDEWGELMRAVSMGQPRQDALGAMAKRINDPDFNTFVTSLVQAERLGVGVAGALKQQAQQLRDKQSQRVEKLAMEAPVKLLFPLVLFIFPVVFLVLFGPVIRRMLQGF